MAESASTGNSGTSTTGTSSTGSTSTSTSTSNGGAAAPGSQSPSNGSSSTGKGNGNGNGGKGPTGVSVGTLGVKGVGPNGEKGTWAHVVAPDSNGKHTITPGPDGKHTVNATFFADPPSSTSGKKTEPVKTEPVMPVDEVFGKGNQSIVESQGDYEASSNEKSNVETSTFGKQDEISVTPLSVTEDKGLVNNDAIQSVEGLNFQQKDKANQEVMEAKKSRDEAESEDNANGMRNQLKAVAEKDAEEDNNAFQVGEKNTFEEQDKAKLAELNQKNQEIENAADKVEQKRNFIEKKTAEWNNLKKEAEAKKQAAKDTKEAIGDLVESLAELTENPAKTFFNRSKINELKSEIVEDAKNYGLNLDPKGNVQDIARQYTDAVVSKCDKDIESADSFFANVDKAQKTLQEEYNNALITHQKAQAAYETAKQEYNTWKTEYWTTAEKTKAEEEAAAKAKAEETPTAEAPAYKGIIDAAKNEIINAKDLTDEQKSEAISVLGNVESAADAMNEAANALAKNLNDINAVQQYVEETAKYNKALKDAKGNNALKNTDFNKTFTRAVADANNFMVTRDDGTQQNYAEFAAEMVTKSPALAKGLYEAKAKNYEENGHKVLAAIENAKAKMVTTWLGSKFTFADNQVRSQFNQMAKTDMRATYATYNNVLNNPTASPEAKAEASSAINQANSLMTASAALQASTGFFSGIGDSMSDGVYGVTDPGKLNGYQEALNTASNFAKIALGLGVTPGANEAYQNMYYMAGAKVNESGLFSKDFDGDGFALCQEYGNNAAVGMIAGAGELATAVALFFNPATSKLGLNLAIDSVQTFLDGLYGVQKEVNKSIKYSSEVLSYFNEAKSIAAETGNKEATGIMDSAVKQIEDFQLKSDEVGNLDNWLEGSGSNTVDNGKFNQALSYDEWLKLIEADPVMQEYAKSLNR